MRRDGHEHLYYLQKRSTEAPREVSPTRKGWDTIPRHQEASWCVLSTRWGAGLESGGNHCAYGFLIAADVAEMSRSKPRMSNPWLCVKPSLTMTRPSEGIITTRCPRLPEP